MYSRYIPPPKGPATTPDLQQTSALPSNTPNVKPQPTAYARYIPPPKPNHQGHDSHQSSQHVRFGEDPVEIEKIPDEPPSKKAKLSPDDSPEKSKKKTKKSKKDKTKRTKDEDQESTAEAFDQGPTIGGDIKVAGHAPKRETPVETPQDAPSEPVEQPVKEKKKKEKKEKRDKKKEKSIDGAAPQSEEDAPRRYKSVLERKAKSMKKAPEPTVVKNAPEDGDVDMQDVADTNGDVTEDAHMNSDIQVEEGVLHGLEPLPQPKPVALVTAKPAYETLPSWLAEPIRVSVQATAPFSDFGISPELGIAPEITERLSARGYKEAFAIQTGVIPLLLPHYCKTMQGDVLVSAATGSGKTLAYALPMIRDISNSNRHVTRLRGLVVLPTRELVKQVQQVCEQCVGVFALDGAKRHTRIAISMGSQTLEQEQNALIGREERYDPEAYARRMRRLGSLNHSLSDDEDEGYDTEDEERAAIRKKEDKIPTLPDHVISYKSKADILICTPGRLVEHIKYTPGFSLDFVRWLVVDEADKLLGQNAQQWLDIVIPRLQSDNIPGARNHKQSNLSGVRKVVLSATMTRDLDLLEGLRLRRPKLVVLEGSESKDDTMVDGAPVEHALPGLLEEAAIKVSDPNLKPLFLLDLLQSERLLGTKDNGDGERGASDASDSDSTSSSGSNSESDSDSDSDSSIDAASKPSRAPPAPPAAAKLPTVLIFTKSNETALRLSRLLSILSPALSPLIGTLTSTTPYATRRDTIRAFLSSSSTSTKTPLRILVASDLVARGVDLPALDHVVNYDVPSSVASYVHRVGRTARAGRAGAAWTLYTNPEARWFWRQVAGGEGGISRRGKVDRVRVSREEDRVAWDAKVRMYEEALERLGREARS